jgi:hypothetical protein
MDLADGDRRLGGVWTIVEAGTPPRPLRPDETVADVEAVVWGVIQLLPTTGDLSAADREELFGALLERVLVLTQKYDPRRDDPRHREPLVFRAWLYARLRLAAIDVLRSWLGRNGQKRVLDDGVHDGHDAGEDRPGLVASADADPARAARALPNRWTRLLDDGQEDRALARLGGRGSARAA